MPAGTSSALKRLGACFLEFLFGVGEPWVVAAVRVLAIHAAVDSAVLGARLVGLDRALRQVDLPLAQWFEVRAAETNKELRCKFIYYIIRGCFPCLRGFLQLCLPLKLAIVGAFQNRQLLFEPVPIHRRLFTRCRCV